MINTKNTALKKQQEELKKKIAYRQSLHRIEQSNKKAQTIKEDYEQKAIAAEKAGHHRDAVQLVKKAEKLQKHIDTASAVKNSVETAYTMNETTEAVVEIMRNGSSAIEGLSFMIDPEALCAAQVGIEMTMDTIRVMNNDQDELYDSINYSDGEKDAEAEAALARLMVRGGSNASVKNLSEMNRALDTLHPITK